MSGQYNQHKYRIQTVAASAMDARIKVTEYDYNDTILLERTIATGDINDGTNYNPITIDDITIHYSHTYNGASYSLEWFIVAVNKVTYNNVEYAPESVVKHWSYSTSVNFTFETDLVITYKETGDIRAIGDWFRSTRYLKEEIDEFFILNNDYSPYEVTVLAPEDSTITITGQTSLKTYTFKMIGDEVTKLLFFTAGETIIVSNGLVTQTIILSDRVFDISFTASIDLVDSYDSKGPRQYTVQENGMYLIILSTGLGYVTTNANITLPQGRSAIVEDLMNYELNNQYQTQVRYCIADLQVGDVITTEIIRNDGSWNTNLNDIYKLSGIPINSNSSIIKHLERVGDGTASYTPPSDNNYYLEIGVAYAVYGNKHNYTDLTDKDPEVVVEEETGCKSLIAFYYGQGNKLPTISMQGYDGGAGVVGCIQI